MAGLGGRLALGGCAVLLATTTPAQDSGSDRLETPLTQTAADAARGRAIVANRQKGLCLLCHSAPIPEERFQGNIAPDLAGAGARLDAAQLRLRLVDPQRLNPDTIMPSYRRTESLQQVAPAWKGRPILSDAEIEDVIAYLGSLGEPASRGAAGPGR